MTGRPILAMLAVIALLGGCTAAPSTSPSPTGLLSATPTTAPSSPPRGGTLRVVVPASEGSSGLRDQAPGFLDPQLYDPTFTGQRELFRCCLTRTLFSTNGRRLADGGARLQPDLAVALPDVSADGLRWTIRIKPGLHYGPPLQQVEITAPDFIRAFHRMLAPSLAQVSLFAWYFSEIQGAADYQAGRAGSITGLEAPDAHTLVVTLTHPIGDFANRLSTTATAPLPPDPREPGAAFGIAQGADDGYGRFLVSSGPYMPSGSEAIDLSRPVAQRKAPAGIASGAITLVRNPSWDAGNDSLRAAYADRIEVRLVDSIDQAVAALGAGTADLVWPAGGIFPSIPPDVYAAFQAAPARGRAYLDANNDVRALIMNLAVPPFDDIHVRKALNYVVDKEQLVGMQGGPVASQVFGHIAPDSVEDGLLLDYDPYGAAGGHGDLAAAQAEMKLSSYDTNRDGRCDAGACKHVRAWTREPFPSLARAAADRFRELGIDLAIEVVDRDAFFATDPTPKTAVWLGLGYWFGYGGAAELMTMFDGRISTDAVNGNTTLIGTTREQLTGWGYEGGAIPPNVDDRVEACIPLVGAYQTQCWAALDQYLMENVVPWVPFSQDRYAALASPRIVSYSYDELNLTTALDRVAVAP